MGMIPDVCSREKFWIEEKLHLTSAENSALRKDAAIYIGIPAQMLGKRFSRKGIFWKYVSAEHPISDVLRIMGSWAVSDKGMEKLAGMCYTLHISGWI